MSGQFSARVGIRFEWPRAEIKGVHGVKMWKQNRSSADEPEPQAKWGLEELMERLGGDHEFLRELLVIFRQDVRVNLQKSHAAVGIGDYEQLSRTAHTMKGILRNLSMDEAGETAAALETASRESRGGDSKELLQKLEKDLEGILPEVEAQLAGVRS
jgi:HPt (histidine-containing phosphotransfer) domain-containing protein